MKTTLIERGNHCEKEIRLGVPQTCAQGSGGRPPIKHAIAHDFEDDGAEFGEPNVSTCLRRALQMSWHRHQAQANGVHAEVARYASLKKQFITLAIGADRNRQVRVRGSEVGWLWSVRFKLRGQTRALHVPKRALIDVIAQNPDCLSRPMDRLDHWCQFTAQISQEQIVEDNLVVWLKLLGTLEVPPSIRNRGRKLVTCHTEGRPVSRWDLLQVQRKIESWLRYAK